ncbi:MAG: SCP2 sterol-binding domain-containing protein [Phenylobacterium sp.]
MATLQELTDRIRRAVESNVDEKSSDIDASIKLDLKGDGIIHIAGRVVTNDDAPADLVVTIALKDLTALGKGELDPTRAMMSGRLKLSDMKLAMKLQPKIQSLFSNAA